MSTDLEVNRKLDEYGRSAVIARLPAIAHVVSFDQWDKPVEDLGDGVVATGKQISTWLSKKKPWWRFWV